MNIRHLELFHLVSTLGSVSKAATRLGLSQPALSRIIRELESTHGLRFFERTGRGVRLTAAGQRFDEQALRVIQEYEGLCSLTADLRGDRIGSVNVSIPLRTGRLILSPLIKEFYLKFPKASVHVYEKLNLATQEGLLSSELDIGVFYTPPTPSGIVSEPVGRERLHVIGTTDMLPETGDGVEMRDVAELPVLMQSEPAHYRDFVSKSFRDAGYVLNVARDLDTLDAHVSFAVAGEGVTILPYSTVWEEVEAGRLAAYPIVEPEIWRGIAIGSGSQASSKIVRGTTVLIRDLIDTMRERARWEPL